MPLRSGNCCVTSWRFSLTKIKYADCGLLGSSFRNLALAMASFLLFSKTTIALAYFLPSADLSNSAASSSYFFLLSSVSELSFCSSSAGSSLKALDRSTRFLPVPALSLQKVLNASRGFCGIPSGLLGLGMLMPLPLDLALAFAFTLTALLNLIQFSVFLNSSIFLRYSSALSLASDVIFSFWSASMLSHLSMRSFRRSTPFASGLAFFTSLTFAFMNVTKAGTGFLGRSVRKASFAFAILLALDVFRNCLK
mmetsp:Transcript_73095/g.165796  ORF Transcript_73095/g.165796 Transcript_73095/m.165796 type:complete len:252 (+) Transcript_73095:1183-1938(+)